MNCRRILKTFGISNHICTYGLQKLVSTSDSIHPIPRSRISEWRRAKLWLDMNLLRAKWFITQQDYKILISSLSSNIKLLAKNVGHWPFLQTWNFLKTLKNDLKHCIILSTKKPAQLEQVNNHIGPILPKDEVWTFSDSRCLLCCRLEPPTPDLM